MSMRRAHLDIIINLTTYVISHISNDSNCRFNVERQEDIYLAYWCHIVFIGMVLAYYFILCCTVKWTNNKKIKIW